MYLPEEAIRTSLTAMAAASRRTSITLSFRQPPNPAKPSDTFLDNKVEALGEPFISSFTEEAIAAVLQDCGFAAIEFLTPAKAIADYYTPQREDLPPPRHTTVLHAST
ncbi:MAG: hypothetical protein P4L57_12975 [Rhizomicrobium sp.]|nr:hypothetical protein [Rhizomicrobium sp.]